jgi:hypothetical protein
MVQVALAKKLGRSMMYTSSHGNIRTSHGVAVFPRDNHLPDCGLTESALY